MAHIQHGIIWSDFQLRSAATGRDDVQNKPQGHKLARLAKK